MLYGEKFSKGSFVRLKRDGTNVASDVQTRPDAETDIPSDNFDRVCISFYMSMGIDEKFKTAVVDFQPELSGFHDKKGRRYLKPQQVAQIIDIKFDSYDKPTATFKVFLRPEDLYEDKAREFHPNILLPSKKNGKNFKLYGLI
jgi:hypothetical protein